jgi:hypothetical protein
MHQTDHSGIVPKSSRPTTEFSSWQTVVGADRLLEQVGHGYASLIRGNKIAAQLTIPAAASSRNRRSELAGGQSAHGLPRSVFWADWNANLSS